MIYFFKKNRHHHFLLLLVICFTVWSSLNAQILFHVNWAEEYQTIDGFGTFAGRNGKNNCQWFETPIRDEILKYLFSTDGLRLTIIRAEVFPDRRDHNATACRHKAQLWILKTAMMKYGVRKFVASTWSPPYEMKSIEGVGTGKGFNHLRSDEYPNFAQYLAEFVLEYEAEGLPIYAISPQNEPEFPTPDWDGCVWSPWATSTFINGHLRPTLNRNNLTHTKIMIGESGNWNVNELLLSPLFMGGDSRNVDILASHGYSIPNLRTGVVTFNTNRVLLHINHPKKRWITEACDTGSSSNDIKMGIRFAKSLHRLITNGAQAYIYWLSMVNGGSNEALINVLGDELRIGKVFQIYGQFSRYIEPGYVLVGISRSFSAAFSPILVSAYKDKKTSRFTIIMINYGKRSYNTRITGVSVDFLQPILTDATRHWVPLNPIKNINESFLIQLPPMSVLTLTGIEDENNYL